MAAYRFTVPAKRDLFAVLADLVEVAGPSVALRYKDRFQQTLRTLAARPGIGHRREDLTKRPYLVFTCSLTEGSPARGMNSSKRMHILEKERTKKL